MSIGSLLSVTGLFCRALLELSPRKPRLGAQAKKREKKREKEELSPRKPRLGDADESGPVCVCVCDCVYVRVCMRVSQCVCARERERACRIVE